MASKSRKPIDLGFDNYNELFMTEQERKDACSLTEKQIERFERMFRSTVLYLSMQDESTEKGKHRKEGKRHECVGR